METKEKKIGGLKPLAPDNDFSLGGIFGTIPLSDIPKGSWDIAPVGTVLEQTLDDDCTGYATSDASADQEGEPMVAEFQFMATKMLSGNPEEWGADLRMACKSAVKLGSLTAADAKALSFDPRAQTRDFIVNQKNWPAWVFEKAYLHRKQTFFAVDGPYDTFDNIKAALWQHREEKRTIVVGAEWKKEWTAAAGGIITPEYNPGGNGHAFKFNGLRVINGTEYLLAKLSNGTDIGDGGTFLFPREVVNKEIGIDKFGAFMFKDMPRAQAEFLHRNGLSLDSNYFLKVFNLLKDIILHKI